MTQNISEQLIAFNNKVADFLSSKGLDQEVTIQNAKSENHISDSKQLQQALDEVNNVDRLLRVGIIGRVKAGKSSLLNALIFEGKDILPKAATPMTAALTRMEYSEDVRAEVEFYDEKDLAQIADNSRQYEQLIHKLKTTRLQELEKENEANKKLFRQDNAYSPAEMERLAEEYAHHEAGKSIELASAYDQHRRIQQANVQLSELQAHTHIEAQSTQDLMGKLNDYVGSSGKYMPFTKSVKLYIPEEGLKDLEIVDTPGVNDPVQSREERTNAFLAQCDVVLVVSPAGQFLSQEDMELMGRVTTKNGIQEAYIIASQADNQLFGSEKGTDYSPTPVLERVTQKLNAQAQKVLSDNQRPEMQRAVALYQKNSVICTSSVADTMARTLDNQQSWDGNTKHVWENFKKHYPDVFYSPEAAKEALEGLSNVKHIRKILDEVKVRKDEIQAERREKLVAAKIGAYREFLSTVAEFIEDRVDDIQSKDIATERKKLEEFKEQRDEYEDCIDQEYRTAIQKFYRLKKELYSILDSKTEAFNKTNEVKSDERQESFQDWEYASNGFLSKLWGKVGGSREKRYFTNYRTIREDVVNARQVYRFIFDLRTSLSRQLSDKAYEFRYGNGDSNSNDNGWEKDFIRQIFSEMKKIHNQYPQSERLDRKLINRTIQYVLSKIPTIEFSITDTIPESLNKPGTLKNREAMTFAREAEDYMFEKFKPSICNDIERFMNKSMDALKQQPISTQILGKLGEQIAQMVHDIENKEESIARYQRMQSDLAKLKAEVPNA